MFLRDCRQTFRTISHFQESVNQNAPNMNYEGRKIVSPHLGPTLHGEFLAEQATYAYILLSAHIFSFENKSFFSGAPLLAFSPF